MLERILMALLNRQQQLAKDIVVMPAVDYALYRALCGRHAGLQEAVNVIEQLMKDDEQDL